MKFDPPDMGHFPHTHILRTFVYNTHILGKRLQIYHLIKHLFCPCNGNRSGSFLKPGFFTLLLLLITWDYERTLKWNSQDNTNANSMQASRKFAKRPSKQPLWVSEFDSPASGVGVLVLFAAAALLLCDCCPDSTSFGTTTFCAIELQISQVLKMIRIFFFWG